MPPTPACLPSVSAGIQMYFHTLRGVCGLWLSHRLIARSVCPRVFFAFNPTSFKTFKAQGSQKGSGQTELSEFALALRDSRVLIRLKTFTAFGGSWSTGVKHTGRDAVTLKNCWIYGGKSRIWFNRRFLLVEIDTNARHVHSWTVSGPEGYCSSVDSRTRTGLRKRHQVLLRVTSKKTNTARLFFFFYDWCKKLRLESQSDHPYQRRNALFPVLISCSVLSHQVS